MKIDRKWCMPNSITFQIKPIKELLQIEVTSGTWLDPFANVRTFKNMFLDNCNIEIIDNDLNPTYQTDFNLDALDFLKIQKDNSIDGVVYDPPYSVRQVSECYKQFGVSVTQETTRSDWWTKHKKEISRIVKKGGKVISFGWNSGGIGKTNGFQLQEVLLVPHGGIHNDTIVTVEVKI
jgi:hypothetical protein